MERIYLVGADEVSSAANRMGSAAREMKDAAASFDYAMAQHRSFMDDWLIRLEAIMTMKVSGG